MFKEYKVFSSLKIKYQFCLNLRTFGHDFLILDCFFYLWVLLLCRSTNNLI